MRGIGRAAGVACTLALLAGIAAAGYVAWGDGSNPVIREYAVTQPDLEPRKPYRVTPPDPLVRPAGNVLVEESARPGQFLRLSSLSERELELLVQHGVAMIQTVITREGALTRAVWRFTVRERTDPAEPLRAIDDLYERGGYDLRPGPAGVRVRRIANPADQRTITAYRAHYVRGNDVLRVTVFGRDSAQVDGAFPRLLRRQIDAFPPTAER